VTLRWQVVTLTPNDQISGKIEKIRRIATAGERKTRLKIRSSRDSLSFSTIGERGLMLDKFAKMICLKKQ